MSTKFPINGKYTTLGDLIHSYAKYATCPYNIDSDGIPNYNIVIDGFTVSEDGTLPFKQIVYNKIRSQDNMPIASVPYEIVWFDNIYSDTERDESNLRMKIILAADSSEYNFDTPIYAKDIYKASYISSGNYKFRFIVADSVVTGKDADDNDVQSYYFNYKTMNGEAVVMYALRNIIDTINNADFSDLNNDNKQEIINTLLYKGIHAEKSTFSYEESYDYYPGLLDVSMAFCKNLSNNDKNIIRIVSSNNNYEQYNTLKCIFNHNAGNITSVKNDAYQYLGNAYWTLTHVAYHNYAYNNKDNFEIVPTVYYNYDSAIGTATTLTYPYGIDVLFEFIHHIIRSKNDNSEKYHSTQESTDTVASKVSLLRNKLEYYCYLFLLSERFYISYVTGFLFIKISSNTYTLVDPVLRCDVDIIQIIESFTPISCVHLQSTALPAGAITEDTTMTFVLTYNIKYTNLPNSNSSSTYTFNVTFKDLKKTQNNDKTKLIWYRLFALPGEQLSSDTNISEKFKSIYKYDQKGYTYGQDNFPQISTTTDLSLQCISWPTVNYLTNNIQYDIYNNNNAITTLEISNDKTSITNHFNNYLAGCSDTYDYNTFNDDNETLSDKLTKYAGKIGPFGMLRIHNVYDDTDLNKINSSYYVDVSIYRCWNWYYVMKNVNLVTQTTIITTYNVIYDLTQTLQYVDINNLTLINVDTDETDNNIMCLNNEKDAEFYILLSQYSGDKYYYASGYNSVGESNGSTSYINSYKCNIYTYGTSDWSDATSQFTINKLPTGTTDTEAILYQITLNNKITSSNNLIQIIFTSNNINEINKKFYLSLSEYDDTTDIKSINIKALKTENNDLLNEPLKYVQSVDFLLYNETGEKINNMYHKLLSFDATSITLKTNLNSLYCKSIALKLNVSNGSVLTQYIYSNTIPIYYVSTNKSNSYNIAKNSYTLNVTDDYILSNINENGYLYISLSPIYVINPTVTVTGETSNLNITWSYKYDSTSVNVTGTDYKIKSYENTLTVDSIKIASEDINTYLSNNDTTKITVTIGDSTETFQKNSYPFEKLKLLNTKVNTLSLTFNTITYTSVYLSTSQSGSDVIKYTYIMNNDSGRNYYLYTNNLNVNASDCGDVTITQQPLEASLRFKLFANITTTLPYIKSVNFYGDADTNNIQKLDTSVYIYVLDNGRLRKSTNDGDLNTYPTFYNGDVSYYIHENVSNIDTNIQLNPVLLGISVSGPISAQDNWSYITVTYNGNDTLINNSFNITYTINKNIDDTSCNNVSYPNSYTSSDFIIYGYTVKYTLYNNSNNTIIDRQENKTLEQSAGKILLDTPSIKNSISDSYTINKITPNDCSIYSDNTYKESLGSIIPNSDGSFIIYFNTSITINIYVTSKNVPTTASDIEP